MKTAYKLALTLNLPPLARQSITTPDWTQKVMAFHDFYDVPIQPFGETDREFRHMADDRVAMRVGFQVEEIIELLYKGFGIDATVHLSVPGGHGYVLEGDKLEDTKSIAACMALTGKRNGKEVVDSATDSIYFWLGMMIEMGFDPRDAFHEVHASNMTKPDENGKPIKREDGKVMKGPNYMEPNIPAALGWETDTKVRRRRGLPDNSFAGSDIPL